MLPATPATPMVSVLCSLSLFLLIYFGRAHANACSLDTETLFPFFISTYVGFVPVCNVLAIFVSDRRCEFSSKFWLVIQNKMFWWTSFGRTLGVPKQNLFW
jgi:hypothetical protein